MGNMPKTNEATSPRPHLDDLVYFLLVVLIHLRFLRNIKLSFWQKNWNPVSASFLISSGFSTTFTVNWSLFDSNIVVCNIDVYFCINDALVT
jgi:hypothetical protein